MLSEKAADELNQVCAGAVEMQEGGSTYIFLPSLTLGPQCRPRKVDALLRIASTTVNDYPTTLRCGGRQGSTTAARRAQNARP